MRHRTNGLLHQLDRVHSLVLRNLDTNEVISCSNEGNYVPVQSALICYKMLT